MRSRFVVCLLSLLFAGMAAAQSNTCEEVAALLSQEWVNELGSHMYLLARADGSLSGEYRTAKGSAAGWYPLAGRMTCGGTENPTVAFSVSWKNEEYGSSNSSTAWAGQVFAGKLATSWLLTRATSDDDAWASTRVGSNTFVPLDLAWSSEP